MGITGLLPLLKDVSEYIHIKKYKGKVLGVDGYVWLHRGAYGCAEALALGRPTTKYVDYAMSQIHMLMHHGIIPYIVFDGDRLPAKAKTEQDRHQRREECLEQARKCALAGNQKDAREQYVRCVDVTPTMAYQLIKRLRQSNIQYIVAPYEADAQLAYLERRGVIDGIVTEDSDLLVFGCKRVLYKLDKEGNCVEYLHSNRQKCKSLAMHSFDDSMFRQMAILSGCDYLPSIPKMGLKTAHQMLRQYGSVARVLNVALTMGMQVPTNYREQFERAERTFVYQRVFHRSSTSNKVRMTTLTSAPQNDDMFGTDDCIGPLMSPEIIEGIANGDIDPITRKSIAEADAKAEKNKDAVAEKSGQTYARSFYAQTRPNFMNGKRVKKATKTEIQGQGKLDSFLVAKPAIREPFADKTNRIDQTNESQSGSVKRARIESPQKAKEKSKYFSHNATQSDQHIPSPASVASSSPVKAYEGYADLARFAMTPTQPKVRYSVIDEVEHDEGHISSPPSATNSASKQQHAQFVVHIDEEDQEDVLPSSPIASPSLGSTKLQRFPFSNINNIGFDDDDDNISSRDSIMEARLKRFVYDEERVESRFRSPNDAIDESVANARRLAGMNERTPLPRHQSDGKIFSASSSIKRTMSFSVEHDPFDDFDHGDLQHQKVDTPLRAITKSPILTRTPRPNGDQLKRSSSSVRKLVMLNGDG
ncbi:hypothetical protein L7F22_043749 [Adiantum nelumboides]|nr:hypothetical protein [Adiantum nelumboides]